MRQIIDSSNCRNSLAKEADDPRPRVKIRVLKALVRAAGLDPDPHTIRLTHEMWNAQAAAERGSASPRQRLLLEFGGRGLAAFPAKIRWRFVGAVLAVQDNRATIKQLKLLLRCVDAVLGYKSLHLASGEFSEEVFVIIERTRRLLRDRLPPEPPPNSPPPGIAMLAPAVIDREAGWRARSGKSTAGPPDTGAHKRHRPPEHRRPESLSRFGCVCPTQPNPNRHRRIFHRNFSRNAFVRPAPGGAR